MDQIDLRIRYMHGTPMTKDFWLFEGKPIKHGVPIRVITLKNGIYELLEINSLKEYESLVQNGADVHHDNSNLK